MKTLSILLLFTLTSCVMDYPQEPPRPSDYEADRNEVARQRYESRYGRTSGNRAARERVLAGTYGQVQPQTRQVQTPQQNVKKEWNDPNKAIARKHPIGTVGYREIEAIIKQQLSPQGNATYIKQFNSILVYDYPANHEKVKMILSAVVRDAVNVRIDVEFAAAKGMSNYGIVVKHGGIVIDNGGVHLPNKAHVDIRGQNAGQTTNTRQFITALSGSAAQLWVTQTAVDKQLFDSYKFIPFIPVGGVVNVAAVPFPMPSIREVGTSLWVRPVYTDDGLVVVELFPVLTTEVGGKKQSFRVEKVETKVVARPGQRVFLGGMNKQTSKFFSSLFNPIGAGKSSYKDVVNIYVTPSVMKVGPRK